MAVSANPRVKIYTGNGSQLVFPYDFKIFKKEDLVVTKMTIATEIEEVLVLDTDYTISGVGEPTGGDVTLLITAPSSLYKIIIESDMANEQTLDLQESSTFPAENVEAALDRSAMRDQQLQDQIDRCIKVVPGASTDPNDLIDDLNQAVQDAEDAKTGAETAQGLSEDARDASVTAKDASVAAKNAAESAVASVPSIVRGTFTNASLSTGKLTVTHNKGLAAPYSCWVEVINNSAQKIIPDQITFATNSFEIDLTSFGTITGTYGYTYVA